MSQPMVDEDCARMLLAIIVANGGTLEVPTWSLAESLARTKGPTYITTELSPNKDAFVLRVEFKE